MSKILASISFSIFSIVTAKLSAIFFCLFACRVLVCERDVRQTEFFLEEGGRRRLSSVQLA